MYRFAGLPTLGPFAKDAAMAGIKCRPSRRVPAVDRLIGLMAGRDAGLRSIGL
jgi:hypothetical protein